MGASSRRRRAFSLPKVGSLCLWSASRLLCLDQVAAAMRFMEGGVMLPGARVSSRRCLSYVINLITAFFAAAHSARPVALTSAARQECSTVTNDASKARTDQRASVQTLVSEAHRAQRGQLKSRTRPRLFHHCTSALARTRLEAV